MKKRDREPGVAGMVLCVGLGAFFDGIVFHQLLQWHHMLSHWSPAGTTAGMELNMLADGLCHVLAQVCVAAGLKLLWRAARRPHFSWSGPRFIGALLMGWGGFNVVEGLVDHILLGVHHVNERAPVWQWPYWDWGFILWGAAFAALGVALSRLARRGFVSDAA